MARRGGWRRLGSSRRFRYVDSRDRRITDPVKLSRIEALVIPPAWRDVWISPNASAKLQATGVDAAGRRQYLYHPDYRAAQEEAKFRRLVLFGERLPRLREAMAEDMTSTALSRQRVCAIAMRLVDDAWFRVGSERYARTSRTYGITTLRKRHVRVRGHRLRFCFRTKHAALVRTTLVDDELAGAVRELLALPGGSRVFRFESDGELRALTGAILNEYVRAHLGEEFTAKDFRTWGGTLAAAVALAERGPVEEEAEAKRAIAAAMRHAGERLGNTAAVARASYVSPAVIELYREGQTIEDFRPRKLRVVSARQTGLEPEERALLALLRSWHASNTRLAA
jgi:DNA topoisomerase-1